MERRIFLKQTGLGLLASVPANQHNGDDKDIVHASDFGAIGDGVNDDTVALQNAIDSAIERGKPCFIPSGTFNISNPLIVGSSSSSRHFQAFKLFGTGKASTVRAGKGGTNIFLRSSGHQSILQIEKNEWRRCEIKDLGLECGEPNGAAYGILFNSTEFSNHCVENIGVYRATSAFGILAGTGANGEFIMFNNCDAGDVTKFFYSNAGQAYVQYFNHCECLLRPNGIYFHLDLDSGGGGINVVDFNATGVKHNGISNTTLVKNGNSNSCLNIFGGRIEHLTQLYEYIGGTTNLHVTANITGLQVVVDCDHDNKELVKPAFINIDLAPDILVIESCSFGAHSGRETINIQTSNASAYVLFKGCHFQGFSRPPYITQNFADDLGQIKFEDCKTSVLVEGTHVDRPIPFDRIYHHVIGAIGRRKAFSENGWVHSGRPINLLVKPQFTSINGKGIHADAPWVHFGRSLNFDAYDWNASQLHAINSSPWAKFIRLGPNSGLYQDISDIDLSSPSGSYSLNGVRFQAIAYQAMISRIDGPASLRFWLTDQQEKTIYDEIVITGNSSDIHNTRLVTLIGAVAQRQSSTPIRMKIENLSSTPAVIEFSWQLVANSYDPAFVGTDYASTRFNSEWGLSAESARLWHRLALPYKADEYGNASIRPLDDLQSDIYLSQSSEKINFYANGRWWTAPRATSDEAPPDGGRWAQGDMVYNSRPSAGGALGWIQISPGQFSAEIIWTPATKYVSGMRIYNGERVYNCIKSGSSADSGGPSTEERSIKDGGCLWAYVGPLASVACQKSWAQGNYAVDQQVHNKGSVYRCLRAGFSANTSGPSGAGSEISDGTVKWRYLGPLAQFKTFGQISS